MDLKHSSDSIAGHLKYMYMYAYEYAYIYKYPITRGPPKSIDSSIDVFSDGSVVDGSVYYIFVTGIKNDLLGQKKLKNLASMKRNTIITVISGQ